MIARADMRRVPVNKIKIASHRGNHGGNTAAGRLKLYAYSNSINKPPWLRLAGPWLRLEGHAHRGHIHHPGPSGRIITRNTPRLGHPMAYPWPTFRLQLGPVRMPVYGCVAVAFISRSPCAVVPRAWSPMAHGNHEECSREIVQSVADMSGGTWMSHVFTTC